MATRGVGYFVAIEDVTDHAAPSASAPVNTTTSGFGMGDHPIIMMSERLPRAGSAVLPRAAPIADVKLVPAMVQPVTVVATPAVSVRVIKSGKPGWLLLAFARAKPTLEAVGTVIVAEPVELAKAVVPAYVAVMELAPAARALPFTFSTAVAFNPDVVNVAEPSEAFPRVKVTLPVGAALPDAGVTVAVSWVEPLAPMLAAPAVAISVVATFTGAVTVTAADPIDPPNAVVPS